MDTLNNDVTKNKQISAMNQFAVDLLSICNQFAIDQSVIEQQSTITKEKSKFFYYWIIYHFKRKCKYYKRQVEELQYQIALERAKAGIESNRKRKRKNLKQLYHSR
jgi:hypothetical protein